MLELNRLMKLLVIDDSIIINIHTKNKKNKHWMPFWINDDMN
jgi:hypothetical protein